METPTADKDKLLSTTHRFRCEDNNVALTLAQPHYWSLVTNSCWMWPHTTQPVWPHGQTSKPISKKINGLVRKEIIPKPLAKQFSPKEASTPCAYGLPKVHRGGCPLRMVGPLIDSPCYSLSKWLQGILRHLTVHMQYSIENSAQFLDAIKNIAVNSNACMTSYYVASLFTCMPFELAHKTIRELLTVAPLSVFTENAQPQAPFSLEIQTGPNSATTQNYLSRSVFRLL